VSIIYINPYRFAAASTEPWTPANVTTALWLDADDASTITLNGSAVSQWNDKSGNNRHATQASAPRQPTRTLSGLNGKTVLTFNGITDGQLMATTFGLSDNYSILLIGTKAAQSTDVTSALRPLVGATGTGGKTIAGIGTLRPGLASPLVNNADFYIAADRAPAVADSWPNSAVRLLSCTYDGTALTGWLNGANFSSPATLSASNFGQIQIGGTDDFTARRFAGSIAEVVIFSSAIASDTRQRVEGYLAHKWGQSEGLPSDHPFKSAAPTV
jgi:hypothetical protein